MSGARSATRNAVSQREFSVNFTGDMRATADPPRTSHHLRALPDPAMEPARARPRFLRTSEREMTGSEKGEDERPGFFHLTSRPASA